MRIKRADAVKFLVVGDGHSVIHEKPIIRALEFLGHEAEGLFWSPYFAERDKNAGGLAKISQGIQNKYLFGPRFEKFNSVLIEIAGNKKPEVIFIYRGAHVKASTLRKLKLRVPGLFSIGYNNDDPFSRRQPRWMWRHFLECIPHYDLCLSYRPANIGDFRKAGAARVALLRSWFLPYLHHCMALSQDERQLYGADVSFVGHYEDDGRLEILERLVTKEFDLKLFGPDWKGHLEKNKILAGKFGTVYPVRDREYVKAICGAKIALCFLSKLNNDSYTRRCFEIPAIGTMMLSEYTEDLASIYIEGKEVEFFRNEKELQDKLLFYLKDDAARGRIAANGYAKVKAAGHDIHSRIAEMVKLVEERNEGVTYGQSG